MAGTINSLGIGSGVLTQDVIDKLKASDEKLSITPITNKITLEEQRGSALNLLKSLLTTFKSSVNALDDDALYQKRSVSGSNDAVNVSADSGVSIQSFSISDITLATKEVKESGAFNSLTSGIASGNGSLSLAIDGESFNINYTSSMTLSELKDAINDTAGDKIKATTLQVGTNDYRLILTSVATGTDQAITLTDNSGFLSSQLLAYNEVTNPNGITTIQSAQNATFKYNGISISRGSNTIEDLITGVSINLKQNSSSGSSISISQDVSAISDELKNLVSSYNSLTSELDDMTTSDAEAGSVGVFNGDSTINSITRQINKWITSINNDGLSLVQFGIDINQDGTMTFNSSTFQTKFNDNPSAAEKLFSGSTTITATGEAETKDGVFTSLRSLLNGYIGSTGTVTRLITHSTGTVDDLKENKTKTQSLINARYESMTARFIQYDAIISKLQNSFTSLQQQIEMAVNGTN